MKSILAAALHSDFDLTKEEMCAQLEIPKDPMHGDLALPCFSLAKKLRQAPPQIAAERSMQVSAKLPRGFSGAAPLGGYINFSFESGFWTRILLTEILQRGESLGNTEVGRGKKVVIDYSSPNVAKPMSIGHLRSTVIGQAIANLHRAMGHEVVSLNYLGDWGVQFGKLAWALLNHKKLSDILMRLTPELQKSFAPHVWQQLITDFNAPDKDQFNCLYATYVLYHAAAETEPELIEFGKDYFVRLENRSKPGYVKDPETEKIFEMWQHILKISLTEYNRVYDLLGVKFDKIGGESQHEPDLEPTVALIDEKGLLKESQGAQIVDLETFSMAPCLIKKADGSTLYATRDIASALYRKNKLAADRLLYVVGAEQSLHFKQVFKVLELMGFEWFQSCTHIPFGLYRFKEGKMSTRRGNVVFLEDVLDRAVELVREIIKQKNPDLQDSERIAKQVGTGAVIFFDLMNDRQKNIDFDWDRLLDFNGDTGPYVQYTHVRCCSVLQKWVSSGKDLPTAAAVDSLSALNEKLEKDLLRVLGRFDDIVRVAYEQLKPNWVAQYLLDLAKAFNSFYYEHRILEGEAKVQEARIALTFATRLVLRRGLALLGISAPERM